jgi:hypothetical protein
MHIVTHFNNNSCELYLTFCKPDSGLLCSLHVMTWNISKLELEILLLCRPLFCDVCFVVAAQTFCFESPILRKVQMQTSCSGQSEILVV